MNESSIYPLHFLKRGYFFILTVFFIFSCTEEFENPGTEETFWVYSYPSFHKPELSLMVSEDEELTYIFENWKRIPFTIQGFTHKQNFFQKIRVIKTENSEAGEVTRKLIEILEEKEDFFYLFEGKWEVKKYLGKDIPNQEYPNSSIFTFYPIGRIGVSPFKCGQLALRIKEVNADNLSHEVYDYNFYPLVCPDLPKVLPAFTGMVFEGTFKSEGNKLYFFNKAKEEIAVWQRKE